VGWTDLNLILHAENVNKLSSLFVTHLDLLDDAKDIKVCTSYNKNSAQRDCKEATGDTVKKDKVIGVLPSTIKEYGEWEASYDTIKGWQQDTTKVTRFDALPLEA
jgi:adenylosuccinate synthase